MATRKKTEKLPMSMRWQQYLRNTASTHIVFVLVMNTMLAQFFYNSAGAFIPDIGIAHKYLFVTAILSTLAFSIMEIRQVFTLNDMLSTATTYTRAEWIKNIGTLFIISVYNFYAMALFNAAIWPNLHISNIPEPSAPWKYYIHAFFPSVILFLAGIVGERHRTISEKVEFAQQDIQSILLLNAVEETKGLLAGKHGDGKHIVAMAALGTPNAQQFFANLSNVFSGKIDIDDIIFQNHIPGVFSPRSTNTDRSAVSLVESGAVSDSSRGISPSPLASDTSIFHTIPNQYSTPLPPHNDAQDSNNNHDHYSTPFDHDIPLSPTPIMTYHHNHETPNQYSTNTLNLEYSYRLPDGIFLDSAIQQNTIPEKFGIAVSTFLRLYNENGISLGVFPSTDNGRKYWQVRGILFLFEQGIFDSVDTTTIKNMIQISA